ncbi:MAG TPA: hypothetical protein PKL65_08770 [Bacteroidales bacterium]|nr:hypothetical protein [Bacteroidales bacterium]HNR42311.1 hypothetical protein [Bacteroidales bacterium]HPM19146.1 hypothetical protein [Bacteroidales bacterium]
MKNFLASFPSYGELNKAMNGMTVPEYREANAHIHTPYSFSAFPDLDTIFRMAKNEKVDVLGINDFNVADGYEQFHRGCLKNGIFPLFNIEFIGLMKDEQKKGIRINDPNNPGRIYFCGKGLDYPFHAGFINRIRLRKIRKESQNQIRSMIAKLNSLIEKHDPQIKLSYESVRQEHARNLVRERHLAKAVRMVAERHYPDPEKRISFIESLYGGKKSKAGPDDHSSLENEIRSNLLKSGGAAFVEEDEKSFLPLDKIMKIIIDAGGIPCYPVLLDDSAGNFTEFESDPEKLHDSLREKGIECIELIPMRNDAKHLNRFVEYFQERGFIITFGTEHNTPDLAPLTVSTRGAVPLSENLKKTAWEGACLLAAHQYLRADGRQGYVLPDGTSNREQRNNMAALGQMVIEYYFNKFNHD